MKLIRILCFCALIFLPVVSGCSVSGTGESRSTDEPSSQFVFPSDFTTGASAQANELFECSDCDFNDPALIASLFADSDNDGRANYEELLLGTDPFDPLDGPDIDGDGIPNGQDPDVDGDGILNVVGIDIDGDGLTNDLDDDADADGIPDLLDEDDNADGEPDGR